MPDKTIIIPGKPIGKARPRFSKVGSFVKVYSAQAKEEKAIIKEFKTQWRLRPLECPVIVSMVFCMPITKASKKTVADMLSGVLKHTKKPDCSNLIKMYEDCANGIIWQDDKQIFEIEATKAFAKEPQTIIRVEW